jgi:hypothetical protein
MAGTGADPASSDAGDPRIEVVIRSPIGVAHVNGAVTFEVAVTNADPSKVELLRDGAAFAEMTRRPYAFTWDTAGLSGSAPVPEGSYRVTARASFGGAAGESSAVTVVVDRTPPSLQEKRPLPPGDSNVGVDDPVELVFSEPMRPEVATERGVGIGASCGAVVWSRELSADGRTLTLRPSTAVSPPCTATASLGEGCKDLAGNQAKQESMTWTIPLWQLLGDPVSTNAGAYSLAVNAEGAPVVAYEDAPGSPGAHVLVKQWNGSSWVSVGSALGTASAASPSVDLDMKGAPTVAWIEGTAAPRALRVASFAGRWSQYPDAITQSASLRADPSHPDVAVADSLDSPWIAFQDAERDVAKNLGSCAQVWNASSGAWTWRGCQAAGWGGGVSLALDLGGQMLLGNAWSDGSELSVHSWSGSAWVARGGKIAYEAVEPSLAVNAHGGVIAWATGVSSLGNVRAKVWDGADWAPRQAAGTPASLNGSAAKSPSAAVDEELGPVIAWVEPSTGFFVKRLNAGSGEWTPVGGLIRKAIPKSNLVFGPSLATDKAGGHLTMAWSQDAVLYVVRLNR